CIMSDTNFKQADFTGAYFRDLSMDRVSGRPLDRDFSTLAPGSIHPVIYNDGFGYNTNGWWYASAQAPPADILRRPQIVKPLDGWPRIDQELYPDAGSGVCRISDGRDLFPGPRAGNPHFIAPQADHYKDREIRARDGHSIYRSDKYQSCDALLQ